jgi:hypothetical protein
MTDMPKDISSALAIFDRAIAVETNPEAIWKALHDLTGSIVGAKLFTVTIVDIAQDVVHRAYTSDAKAYPLSGTKPITRDAFFEMVHVQRKSFVANTIQEIAKVFPDHEQIWSLGCGSVINLPFFIGNDLKGTLNLLDVEHYYTPERVAIVEQYLSLPTKLTYLAAKAAV